jgi:enhancing lycopene biosynthesis protein 2
MKFAIILAGCGQHDGSETHEVITALLAMEQQGIDWFAFAPDRDQSRVVNHITNEENPNETRHIIEESARLVRGRIKPLTEIDLNEFDAVIFPGGFGAATNWCNWMTHGIEFDIKDDIKELVQKAQQHQCAFGFICIAPVMIAKLFEHATLTIGNDETIAKKLESLGAKPVICSATEVAIDRAHKIVSTPANMLAENMVELYQGIYKLIEEVAQLSKAA